MNTVILSGNLGGQVETKVFSNGNKKYSFSVATSGGYTDAKGARVDQTEWHKVETIVSVKASDKLHAYYADNLQKGTKVTVQGMNRTSKWQDATGQDRTRQYVAVEYSNGGTIEIQGGSQGAEANMPAPENDVPF